MCQIWLKTINDLNTSIVPYYRKITKDEVAELRDPAITLPFNSSTDHL